MVNPTTRRLAQFFGAAAPTVDSGSFAFALKPSAAEVHVNVDSATAALTFTPHLATAYVDSATFRMAFTPSATEVYTTANVYVDSGSTYLTFVPSATPSFADSATIPVGFLVTTTDETYTHPPAVYTDASTVALKYTAITTHECIAHLRPQFEAEIYRKWQSVAFKRFSAVEESRRWSGEVTALPVSDPC